MSPMTVIVLFRNAPHFAASCLQSLAAARLGGGTKYLLIDDCSDPAHAVLPLLTQFRDATSAEVRIARFRRPMHYGLGLAYALSLAPTGEDVLFVSHDMMLTSDCVAAMGEVAGSDQRIGVIRPTSQHMDWAKSLAVSPPKPVSSIDDASSFSREVRNHFRTDHVDWPMLIGDAMWIRRAVIDRIGVFDPRFPTFMGDIDFGVRAARAGFRHVIARGAWLHHEGNGTAKETAAAGAESVQEQGRAMVALVEAAYEVFRQKWGEANLPPHFRDMKRRHFEALHALPPMDADAFVPPITWSDDVGEIID